MGRGRCNFCLLIQILFFPFSIGRGRGRGRRMCPLRVILIFLSASLAGFFMLRGLRSQGDEEPAEVTGGENSLSLSGKVRSAMSLGFWTCVDMASGRYLWRNLVSSPAAADSGKKI